MSWDVDVCENDAEGDPIEVPSHTEGGNYVVGGNWRAELNVTYNYSPQYHRVFPKDRCPDGFRSLNGMAVGDAIPLLEAAVENLGTVPDEDYWKATPGNAGKALALILSWCKLAVERGQKAVVVIH